jgi:hypothetical protein
MYIQTTVGFRSTKTDLGTFSCTRLLEESVTAVFTTLPVSPQVPLSHQAKYHFLGRTTNTHYQSALMLCQH